MVQNISEKDNEKFLISLLDFFLENCESIPAGTVGKVLSALTNMVKDSEIRKSLVENDGIWKVLASAISRVDHKRDEGSFDLRFVIEI